MSNTNYNNNKVWIVGELNKEKFEPAIEYRSIAKTGINNIMLSALITSIKNDEAPPIFTAADGYSNLIAINVDINNPNLSDISGILYNKSKTTLIRFPPNYPLVLQDTLDLQDNLDFVLFPGHPQTNTILTKIGDYAFFNNSRIQNVDTSSLLNLQTIGKYAFDGCNITNTLTLSSSITTLDIGSIKDNHNLTDVGFYGDTSLIEINELAFYNCYQLQTFQFESCFSLTSIKNSAFEACFGLTEIDIGFCNSLTTIGDSAFHDTTQHPDKHVKSLMFPNSIETIGYSAFENNYQICSITFREGTNFDNLTLNDDCFRDICSNLLVFTSAIDISTNALVSKLAPTLNLSSTTNIEYIDYTYYKVDIIDLTDTQFQTSGLLIPSTFSYSGFMNGILAFIFTSGTGLKLLQGKEMDLQDFKTNLDFTLQLNVQLFQEFPNTYTFDITDINNLTGFSPYLFDYGKDYTLVRYRRGIYIPKSSTSFQYRISVHDKAIVLLYNIDSLHYLEHTFSSTATTQSNPNGNNNIYEIPVDENDNRWYILTIIFYSYVGWQHLSFRPLPPWDVY